MKTVKQRILLGALLLVGQVPQSGQATTVSNGDFSNDLQGWVMAGAVTINTDGEAVLSDGGTAYSLLYQGVPLSKGSYTLEFDFNNQLSNQVPLGTFPDGFFASIYFIDDLPSLNIPQGNYDAAIPLFDMSFTGITSVAGGAQVGMSTAKPGWSHFNLTFSNGYDYVIPAFELFDQNFIDNDSRVLVDNVALNQTTIPEPATWLLLLSGLLGCWGRVRKVSR